MADRQQAEEHYYRALDLVAERNRFFRRLNSEFVAQFLFALVVLFQCPDAVAGCGKAKDDMLIRFLVCGVACQDLLREFYCARVLAL